MDFTLTLTGLSIYILFWEKLPEWGTWFNWIVARLPAPLAYLYAAWRCPYCFGFWVALALHGMTGLYTLPELASMPGYMGLFSQPLAWFLDALATAPMILVGKLVIDAIAAPAIKGHIMKEEFKKTRKQS
jgi:hypothetical protein